MMGVANGKIQKTRTAEDIRTDSEFDMNDAQPPAKTQPVKSGPIVQAVGARNIMVRSCCPTLMHPQANSGV